jgi:orotidine-5'-phosphate decarboxylase
LLHAAEKKFEVCIMIPATGLCVGLDLDREKLPAPYRDRPDGLTAFGCDVVDVTRASAACYKINLAFFEQYGREGLEALYAIRERCGDAYVIADAKRGDIGNTSAAYAKAVFEDLQADAITVSPYMGSDSVGPFLDVPGKMVYVLAITSNPGSRDFQRLDVNGMPLYEHVMRQTLAWPRNGDVGFVVGATNTAELAALRTAFPDVPFLIPGLGSQGGDENATVAANAGGPAVFNVSRGLLYRDPSASCLSSIEAEAVRLHGVLTSRS